MKVLWRRRVLAAALSFTAAVGGLLVAGTAHAQTVTSGTVSFSGDSGDFISQGKSYSYSSSKGDALSVSSSNGRGVSIQINAYNSDWWTLDIDAPGTQSSLTPGTYSSAHRYPFNGNGPGLSLSGNGRGCNTLTGSFTVTKAVFGPNGYVQTFDATFVQHCEGGTPAAHGEVHISNPPPPAQPAPKHTAPASPHATTGGSNTTTNSPQPTPSNTQGTTVAGGSNTPATDPGASAPAMSAAAAKSATNGAFLLIGLGIIVWVGLVVIGLVTGGVVMATRRR